MSMAPPTIQATPRITARTATVSNGFRTTMTPAIIMRMPTRAKRTGCSISVAKAPISRNRPNISSWMPSSTDTTTSVWLGQASTATPNASVRRAINITVGHSWAIAMPLGLSPVDELLVSMTRPPDRRAAPQRRFEGTPRQVDRTRIPALGFCCCASAPTRPSSRASDAGAAVTRTPDALNQISVELPSPHRGIPEARTVRQSRDSPRLHPYPRGCSSQRQRVAPDHVGPDERHFRGRPRP